MKFLPLISSVFVTLLGIFVYIKRRKTKVGIVFLLFTISISIWLFGTFMMFIVTEKDDAIFWDRFIYSGVIFIPVLIYHFNLIYTESKNKLQKLNLRIFYIISFIFLPLVWTDYFVKGLFRYKWGAHSIAQPLHHLFLLFFWILIFLAMKKLFVYYRNLKSTIERNRTRYIFIAFFSLFFIGAYAYLPAYKISIYPFPFVSGVIFAGILAYAIVKYRIMDIKLALTRGMVFGIVYMLILSVPFGAAIIGEEYLSSTLGSKWWLFPIFISVIIASLGPGIYGKLKNKAEWALFRQQKKYQHTLVAMGKRMTLTKNINELLTWITRTVTTKVGVSYTRIFLWDEEKTEYNYRKGYGKERRRQYKMRLGSHNALIQYLKSIRDPVLKDEVFEDFKNDETKEFEEVRKYIRNTGAELIVPAFIKDKMIGFMTLGVKNNNRIYTPEDIDMFSILAGQAALAIENAEFYERIKESEAMLIQASKMSSIGQMASGFAHNINNPFNSILVNAELMNHTFKNNDVRNLTDKLVKQLKESLSFIMENAEKGGQIVKSIMKFSKPSSGEKKVLDVRSIIDESLKLAASKIKNARVQVELDIDAKIKIYGDDVQLEQVFMNLLTNAVDAVAENGKERKIFIKASKNNSKKAIIEVSDTGGGIPEEVMDRLFDFFYTTKRNAGTGLGLALSYQIVKAHGGQITAYNSQQGGAVFRVALDAA